MEADDCGVGDGLRGFGVGAELAAEEPVCDGEGDWDGLGVLRIRVWSSKLLRPAERLPGWLRQTAGSLW